MTALCLIVRLGGLLAACPDWAVAAFEDGRGPAVGVRLAAGLVWCDRTVAGFPGADGSSRRGADWKERQ